MKLLGPAFLIWLTLASPAFSQDASVEMHWIGLFGPYSRHPPPGDPLPDVTLFPFGEIPRPLVKTNQVPGRLGSRFGFLFTLHGPKASSAEVRLVIHYPLAGIQTTDERMLCMPDLPCYVGYSFQRPETILPGDWRMELLVDGTQVQNATFIVVGDAQAATGASGSLELADQSASGSTPDFEFEEEGRCSGNGPFPKKKMTVKRGRNGFVRARIVFMTFCVPHDFAPRVDYQEGLVKLRVEWDSDEMSIHCSCATKLTFTLKREVPRGTPIMFGFGDYDEPHLQAVAP